MAECKGKTKSFFSYSPSEQIKALAICKRCQALFNCLGEAIQNKEEYGIWGGLLPSERRRLAMQNDRIETLRDIDKEVELVKPLPVQVYQKGSIFYIFEMETGIYGCGMNRAEAKEDFQKSLVRCWSKTREYQCGEYYDQIREYLKDFIKEG